MVATLSVLKFALFSQALLGTVLGVTGSAVHHHERVSKSSQYTSICKDIEGVISDASGVFYSPDEEYTEGIEHWATSSTQSSACSVEPGTAEDVGKILQIIAQNRTPFAVKGGGHATNEGFSSTDGVHIALSRFNSVVYNADAGTVDIGAGLLWDNVYEELANYSVNVVGARVSGVGVAGFTLGGGYSFLTNQYGLTVDTVLGFEHVLPDGTVINVTCEDEDLFFGLRGGFNNFGIVTKFTLKTFPLPDQVWGGLIIMTGDQAENFSIATSNFQNKVTDPKASIISSFNTLGGQPLFTLNIFYDGPNPPDGIFDEFLGIPNLSKDVSTRSFASLIASSPSTDGLRGVFHTVSVTNFSKSLIDVIRKQLNDVTSNIPAALNETSTFLSYAIEPFLPTILTHGAYSAYPPSRDRAFYPLNIYFAWANPSSDDYFQSAIKQTAQAIEQAAIAEGQDVSNAALYGNYAIAGTDLSRIYGDNLPWLQYIKAQVDPDNVMGLTGGWKF